MQAVEQSPPMDFNDLFSTDFLSLPSSTSTAGGSPSSIRSTPPPLTPLFADAGLFSEPSMFTSSSSSSSSAADFFNNSSMGGFMDSQEMMHKPTLHSSSSMASDPFGLGSFDFSHALSAMASSSSTEMGTLDPSAMMSATTSTLPTPVVAQQQQEAEPVVTAVPVKAGGHGKGGRKGTVQSGGVSKTTPPAKKVKLSSPAPVVAAPSPSTSSPSSSSTGAGAGKENHGDEDDDELPADWRPAPEVFAKMSSKEKRQLRNKISARNFRIRRKEYITTLEGDIAERDSILAAIRSELGTSQSENTALRNEIAALKRALLSGRAPSPAALTSNIPAAPTAQAAGLVSPAATPEVEMKQQFTPPTSPLMMPNVYKDLPSVSANKGFWAGATGAGAGSGIGLSVHRMVLPEVDLERAFHSNVGDGDNINPLMNAVRSAPQQDDKKNVKEAGSAGFEQWSESHHFSLKNLDAYRMQLWQQMALRQQQQQQGQQQQLNGLAAGVRPHFFLGGLGVSRTQGLLTPPSSPPLALLNRKPSAFASSSSSSSSSSSMGTGNKMAAAEDAYLAQLASQTLMKRLGSAFWDAFKGKEDGVQRVLEGRAVVRIVDVEPPTARRAPVPLRSASVPPVGVREQQGQGVNGAGSEESGVCRMLEESMRSLSLVGKK